MEFIRASILAKIVVLNFDLTFLKMLQKNGNFSVIDVLIHGPLKWIYIEVIHKGQTYFHKIFPQTSVYDHVHWKLFLALEFNKLQ